MREYPKDTLSQQIGREGESHVKALIERAGGIYHTISSSADYGIDGRVEIPLDGSVTGLEFFVQVKSVGLDPSSSGNHIVAPQVRTSTIQYWLGKLTPTLILLYSKESQTVWFSWAHEAFDQVQFHDAIRKSQKSLQPYLPVDNVFTETTWDTVVSEVHRIYHGLTVAHSYSRDVSEFFNCVSDTCDILTHWLVSRTASHIDDGDTDFYWNLDVSPSMPLPSSDVIPAIPMYAVQLLFWNLRAMLMIAEQLDGEEIVNSVGKDSIVFITTQQFVGSLELFYLSAYGKEDQCFQDHAKDILYSPFSRGDQGTEMQTLSAHMPAIIRALSLITIGCQDYLKFLRRFMWQSMRNKAETEKDTVAPVLWLQQISWNQPVSVKLIPKKAHDYEKLWEHYPALKSKMEQETAQQEDALDEE